MGTTRSNKTRKVKTKPAAKATGRAVAKANQGDHNIRIRMYRIGFGDCFLISLPAASGGSNDKGASHILVDCGVHAKGDIKTMERVIQNIAEVTNRKLAVVIATHAHQDHILGFGKFAEEFAKFDVDEVWLPWAMDKNDKRAANFEKKTLALTSQLENHFTALAANGASVDNKVLDAIENLKGNEKALELLRRGFGVNAKVRYLTAGKELKNAARIPGLSVKVLGPPESEDFLSQMDPPQGHHYLAVVDGQLKPVDDYPIFVDKWIATNSDNGPRLHKDEVEDLRNTVASPLDELAFSLDKAMNNTSLVTLLVFRETYLLFPGDAQYGNWRWWLENEESDDILSRINFYKVSHHGSMNATPKDAVEKMSVGSFAAMASTQSTPWQSIPQPELMTALSTRAKNRIVRSDWLHIDNAPDPLESAMPTKPKQLPQGFSKGPLWFDYSLEL